MAGRVDVAESEGVMIGLPYLGAAPLRHRNGGRPAARAAGLRARLDVRLRSHRLRPPTHRAWPHGPRLRRPAALSGLLGLGRSLRLQRHRHRRPHHRAGLAKRAGASPRSRPSSRPAGGQRRTRSASLRPDDTPHATAYIAEMVALIEDLVERGVALRDLERRLPRGRTDRGLRPSGAPAARLPAGRGPSRGRRGEAQPPRLRAVEEGQAGRAHLAESPSARAAPVGTPSAL